MKIGIPILDVLASEAFEVAVGHILPAPALRKKLQSLAEVREAIEAVNKGYVPENAIRKFISDLMMQFRPGQRFIYDIALAALAVILERRPTDFADEYLCHLARLKLAEMPTSIRVARECMKHRAGSITRNQYKSDEYEMTKVPIHSEDFKAQPLPYRTNPSRRASIPSREYDGVASC